MYLDCFCSVLLKLLLFGLANSSCTVEVFLCVYTCAVLSTESYNLILSTMHASGTKLVLLGTHAETCFAACQVVTSPDNNPLDAHSSSSTPRTLVDLCPLQSSLQDNAERASVDRQSQLTGMVTHASKLGRDAKPEDCDEQAPSPPEVHEKQCDIETGLEVCMGSDISLHRPLSSTGHAHECAESSSRHQFIQKQAFTQLFRQVRAQLG